MDEQQILINIEIVDRITMEDLNLLINHLKTIKKDFVFAVRTQDIYVEANQPVMR